MTADTSMLMGEIIEDPEGEKRDVEQLLENLLEALIKEQSREKTSNTVHSDLSVNL